MDRDAALRVAGSCAAALGVARVLRALWRLSEPKHAPRRLVREPCHVEGAEPHPLFAVETHVNPQGLRLFVWRWPAAGAARGTVVLSHGLGEHCGRYAALARRLSAVGYDVVGHDHQGHGRSEGDRGYVERFAHYVDDFVDLCGREAAPGAPVFVVGHSMGGLIAVHAAPRLPALRGIVLSAPATLTAAETKTVKIVVFGGIARAVGGLLPKLPLAGLDAEYLSHDAAVVDQYLNDPLVYKGGVRARWGAEFLSAMARAPAVAATIAAPLLVVHGTDDRIVPIGGSRALVAAWAGDATLAEVDGAFHEAFNEPGREATYDAVVAWLDARA